MKKTIHIRNIADIQSVDLINEDIRRRINCITLDCEGIVAHLSEAIFLNASTAILVLSGTAALYANYKSHKVNVRSAILLSASHLFSFGECSRDFSCLCLFVSREFMDEMDSTDMIYRRIKYGVRLFDTPVVALSPGDALLLKERINAIGQAIGHPEHLYYKEVILNSLFAFYLDMSNVIDRGGNFGSDARLTRYEALIRDFIELLVGHYRREHKVEFYASRLNVSAHYLTLIVKRVTGRSVSDFIFEMLYGDARTLLAHSSFSVQEITGLLNFSDQSAFGKFFRRRSGLSPVDYRTSRR